MNALPAGFDFGDLSGLSWDGIDLQLPDLSFIRFQGFNLEWFNSMVRLEVGVEWTDYNTRSKY